MSVQFQLWILDLGLGTWTQLDKAIKINSKLRRCCPCLSPSRLYLPDEYIIQLYCKISIPGNFRQNWRNLNIMRISGRWSWDRKKDRQLVKKRKGSNSSFNLFKSKHKVGQCYWTCLWRGQLWNLPNLSNSGQFDI